MEKAKNELEVYRRINSLLTGKPTNQHNAPLPDPQQYAKLRSNQFEPFIKQKMESLFNKQFQNIRELIVFRKRYLRETPTKLNVNWKEIGDHFGMNAKQAHVKFDALEIKYLQKWDPMEIEEMRTEMQAIYKRHKDLKTIRAMLDDKFHFSTAYEKQAKQIDNLLSHEHARLTLE